MDFKLYSTCLGVSVVVVVVTLMFCLLVQLCLRLGL